MPPKKTSAKSAKMDFETALAALQEIVSRMENEQQSLDASVADYEKGTELVAICQQQLDTAQLKVEQLLKTKDGQRFEPLNTNQGDD